MLTLILKLLSEATNLTPILVTLIQQLRNQGTDVDAIIKASADRFSENERREIEHLASLPPKAGAKASRQARTSETFSYADGKVTSDAGWSYDIKERFMSQLNAQPQYRGLTDIDLVSNVPAGAYHIANMATGLADKDYREKHAVAETGWPVQSDFGAWLEDNKQPIWNDAAVWFAA